MNSTLDLDALLKEISICARELTCAETGSTMLYDPERDELYFKVPLGDKADILRRLTVRSEPPSVAWWVFANGRPAIINDTASDSRFSGSVDKVTSFESRSILCVPIILTLNEDIEHRTEIIGVIEVINKIPAYAGTPQFTVEDQRMLSIFAYQAAIAVRNAKAVGDRRNFFVNAIEIFVTAIESSGFVPPGHCMRVARSSVGMAHKLGLEHDDLHNLYYASALHDIGVLDIRCRQSPISNGSCPESHTIIGAEMVRPVNLLARTEPIIRHHHEAWDGSGYPDGVGGDDIPLGARIVAVAEAYEDSCFGYRVARGSSSQSATRQFIAANAGKLFDPDVADAFMSL
jgi:HD-GYP domain-containing protein (c-di-GMP phosphodiesterase class II)